MLQSMNQVLWQRHLSLIVTNLIAFTIAKHIVFIDHENLQIHCIRDYAFNLPFWWLMTTQDSKTNKDKLKMPLLHFIWSELEQSSLDTMKHKTSRGIATGATILRFFLQTKVIISQLSKQSICHVRIVSSSGSFILKKIVCFHISPSQKSSNVL